VNITKPVRKEGIFIQDIGRETLLYSDKEKLIHVLNPTAKLIWELCDGMHTVEDMERTIRESFSLSREHDVMGDIQRTLGVFARKGMVGKITWQSAQLIAICGYKISIKEVFFPIIHTDQFCQSKIVLLHSIPQGYMNITSIILWWLMVFLFIKF
jgi:hypothetical protein